MLDSFVDWLLRILTKYKNKRKLAKIRERDPFIYS